jgi:hypothetical protein
MRIMNKMSFVKHRWIFMALICLISFGALASTTGCAGKTNTSTISTTTSGNSGSGTTTVTTQKETVTSAHPRGVIGGLFYTIGQIIWFPFRVIGNLFS